MPDKQITDVTGALRTVADFTQYKDSAGNALDFGQTVEVFRANGTIVAGDLVSWVVAVAGTPLSVKQALVADTQVIQPGVALDSAVAGGQVRVVTAGFALVKVEAAVTPAFGDTAIKGATTAGATQISAVNPPDATTVAGTIVGIYLGAKLTALNICPIWIRRA